MTRRACIRNFRLFETIEQGQAARGDPLCRQRRGKLVLRGGRVSR
jgi:hypothetical protein